MSSPVARAVRAAVEDSAPSMAQTAALVERITLEADLRDALVAGDLVLRYQPIVDLATGRPIAFEALCRWRHWSRGLLSPADFLPLAEEAGLIVPLGGWVLGEACRRLGLWRARLPEAAGLRVTVNLSPAELRDGGLVDRAASALDAAGLPAERLLVEVSEAAAYADPQDGAARNLRALTDLGIGLAVDDIGAPRPGHRSGRPDPGGWLWTLPVRLVKIDRGVAARGEEHTLRSALRLAADRRILAVAKGIGTADQLSRLYRLGCPAGQGFLFARPLDSADSEAYLRRLPAARSWVRAAAG
ncbi:MAG TPA: EAL domain-containing protein [Acidimicrobiia bacterium]|nr:EAL domain-containing protein [Acidimicrobiia bacterium]